MAMEGRRTTTKMGDWFLLVCIWAWNLSSINGDTNPSDVSALTVLYTSLNSAPQLTGWTTTGADPCGQSWRGITCSGSSVTEIKLPGMGLTGNLGYQLMSLTSIVEIDVSNNNLAGNIDYNLPQTLQRLNLAGSSFTGSIPYSISQMTALQYLNLGRNQLQGSVNVDFASLSNLTTMDLSSNSLSGNLPDSLKNLSSLTNLYLQNDQFTGPIDVLANLPLKDLNVAYNNFTGWIPDRLKNINNLQIDGNSWSTGPAPPPPPYMPPPPGRPINPGKRPGPSGGRGKSPSNGSGGGKSSGIGGVGIAGIIIAVLFISAILAFFLVRRKKKKSSVEETHDQNQTFTPLGSDEVKVDMKPIQASSEMHTTALQPPASISLKPPPIDRLRSSDEDEFSSKSAVMKADKNHVKVTMYSVADLQMATNSFSADNLVGEGSLGSVYRAQFSDGKVLAVKKINSSALSNHGSEDFIDLVTDISRLHPSLSELVGYCSEHGQHLLVYEFYRNGSLHDFLHLSDEYNEPLTWNARVKIALGSARALEYLHEVCSPSVVHKNFRTANILLDMELNPHLSECGLASLVPNMEYQDSGHSAPEVAMSGQYTMNSDVFAFGVVMLELLTGRKAFDSSKPRSEQSLVRWAAPQLHDIDALDKMVDPALGGLYSAKSLSRFADVIALCVQPEPEFRPPMSEVVQSLVRLVQRANMSGRLAGRDDTTRRVDDPDQATF